MYPIIEIPANTSSQLEQLGTKAKDWYWDENGRKVLFKEGRHGTGENWAEKVCCEIARSLNLPHAEYELARWDERRGVISPIFIPENGRLIHGNELLARFHSDYDEAKTYKTSQHLLRLVTRVLGNAAIHTPLGWGVPAGISSSLDVFTGYLMLDALVSNQDRHHENWGLVLSPSKGLFLAPTFDHASSLGRNETDESRLDRLHTTDRGRSVDHYTERARSGLYHSLSDKKPMSTYRAFEEAAKIAPQGGRYWLERLNNVQPNDFEYILRQVPGSEISEPAILFALKMLEINRDRLLKGNIE